MRAFLQEKGFEVRISPGNKRTPYPGQVLGCSFESATVSGAPEILYVGTGLFHPIGIALSTRSRVIAFDPLAGIASEVNGETLQRRRFTIMEKARNAASVGVIVSTKSGQQRLDLARRLASLSPITTIVMMREVVPDELLNLGFDAYVNTACPRIAYDDQIRFPVPVLSPPEFEIVCGVRSWDDYTIDQIS
jgi:2-(3-amino-3-carboxypropyl)histidine synthase